MEKISIKTLAKHILYMDDDEYIYFAPVREPQRKLYAKKIRFMDDHALVFDRVDKGDMFAVRVPAKLTEVYANQTIVLEDKIALYLERCVESGEVIICDS